MILIGQYDSPFVRRVGIALTLYGMAFEHRAWSVFGDAERLRAYNPLMRVPTLVLEDGFALIDSASILDHLDSLVPPDRALCPDVEPARRHVMQATALATGLAEKAVALFYEIRMHPNPSPAWSARCADQITTTLSAIEAARAAVDGPYWCGTRITHADIALTCAWRFLADAHGMRFDLAPYSATATHARWFEASPAFQAIAQDFTAPA